MGGSGARLAGARPGDPPAPGPAGSPVQRPTEGAEGVGQTLRRLTRYLEKRYGFSKLLGEHLREGRKIPQIPLSDVSRSVFLLFAQRLKSLNALDEVLKRRGRPLVGKKVPSADTIGYAYARMDPQGLRDVLKGICRKARRNKALRPRNPTQPMTVAIDGHEHFKSYWRCCPQCLTREIQVGQEKRIQFYHQSVVASLVDSEPLMALDAELLGPGEGERTAAMRLVKRLLRDYPFIEAFTMDALYLEAPILRAIVEAERGAIVVLKEERRDLYQDVCALLPTLPAKEEVLDKERIQVWDIPGFTSWPGMEGIPVRVVRTIRHRKVRHKVAGQWVETMEAQDWMWAVVGMPPSIPALTIHRLGHARWDEEEIFNEQDREFGLDHCFKHDPKAILNFILSLFLAQFLTELFFTRNLKSPLLEKMSLVGLARMLLEHPPGPSEASIWALAQGP